MREHELHSILRAEAQIKEKIQELEDEEETEHIRLTKAGYHISLGYLAGLREGAKDVF